MCHFPVVAAPEEFSPIDDCGRTWPRRRGPSATSSGAVVLKVRVWSDAEREGGGTAACVGAGCLIVLNSCVLAPAIGGSRGGASFGEESRECGGRVTEVGGR